MHSATPIHCLQFITTLIALCTNLLPAACSMDLSAIADGVPESWCNSNANDRLSYLHIAETGAMVGGGTAISNIRHVSAGGLVQTARLTTSGLLQTLASTRTGTRPFLEEMVVLLKRLAELKQAAQDTDKAAVAEEYYPPTITVCSLLPPEMGRTCVIFEGEHPPDELKSLIAETDSFLARLDMTEAIPGIYVTLQLIPDAKERFISVDYDIAILDEGAKRLVGELMANEMAIVQTIPLSLSKTTPKAACAKMLEPGCAFYIQAEGQVYLITVSQKTNSNKKEGMTDLQ
jgi:hypothetical protein